MLRMDAHQSAELFLRYQWGIEFPGAIVLTATGIVTDDEIAGLLAH